MSVPVLAPMLEQQAQVIRVIGDQLTVIPLAGLGCAQCAAGQGCGGAFFGRSKFGVPVELTVRDGAELAVADVRAGDVVVLGVPARSLQRLVLMSYGLPLLLMVLAVSLAAQLQLSEPVQAGAALVGLLISTLWLQRYLRARSVAPLCHLLQRKPATSRRCFSGGQHSLPT